MQQNHTTDSRSHFVTSTVSGERIRAFVPPPLPPARRALDLTSLQAILSEANQAVGRLDGMTSALPDLKLFLYSYVRKEAVLSSQIEGTQSSLSDLLLYENAETPGVPLDDVEEVSNYVAALNHGLKRMRDGFPLSLRLVREIHQILLGRIDI
jgi:Fic family protein